jgi:hypothetical protein
MRKSWAIAYVAVLAFVVLAPFNFTSPIARNGARVTDSAIEFAAPGIVRSASPVAWLANDLARGAGFTLEVWAATSNARQRGPARIVSYSRDPWLRNFSLGQHGAHLIMRLRTTRTDLSGERPHARVMDVFASTALQHIVVTYDYTEQNIFVNGKRQFNAAIPGGDFANWDPRHVLVLGNEATGDRPWLGKLLFVALYDRVLVETEIVSRHTNGPHASPERAVMLLRPSGDSSGQLAASPALDLEIPGYFIQGSKQFLGWPMLPRTLMMGVEFIANVALFVPLGFLAHTAHKHHASMTIAVLLTGMLASLGIESLQYFLPDRISSLLDVFANVTGMALGIAFHTLHSNRLAKKAR